jgi:hypothetical protein
MDGPLEKPNGDHPQVADDLILRLCFFKSTTTIKVKARTSAYLRGLSDFSLNPLSIHLKALVSTTSSIPFRLEPCSRDQHHNTRPKHHLRNYHGVENPKPCSRQVHFNFKFTASPLENCQYHEDYPLLAAAVLGRDD